MRLKFLPRRDGTLTLAVAAVDAVNALPDDPYTAPYEDLRLKSK